MMNPIHVDPELLQQVSSACQASSGRLNEEAANMRSQLAQLQEALQGVPRIAMADRFQQLNSTLAQLSTTLEESDSYIRGIVARVEQFVIELQNGN